MRGTRGRSQGVKVERARVGESYGVVPDLAVFTERRSCSERRSALPFSALTMQRASSAVTCGAITR